MAAEYTREDRDIAATVGSELVIAVASNPTTGYTWHAHVDSAALALIDHAFAALGTGVGAGGVERFRFKVLAAGDSVIRLVRKRAWEAISVEDLTFRVHASG